MLISRISLHINSQQCKTGIAEMLS